MEMNTPEQQPREPVKRTRLRLAAPRKQLERTIQKITKLSDTPMKPEKLVDLLTALLGAQLKLLDIDMKAKHDAVTQENGQLKEQHDTDASTITHLKSQVSELESRANDFERATDAELSGVKGLNAALETLLKLLATGITSEGVKLQMAVRVLSSCPQSASQVFLPMLGLSYTEYARMMLYYKTEKELRDIVARAVDGDGTLSRFARARLAVEYPPTGSETIASQPFVPDKRSAEEKIAEAKAMMRNG
jgi:hypothetical protein